MTDWKKPYLMDHYDDEEEEEQPAPSNTKGGKKAKMAKHSTMKGTAKVQNVHRAMVNFVSFIVNANTTFVPPILLYF